MVGVMLDSILFSGSIRFGEVTELMEVGHRRVEDLRAGGSEAHFYGDSQLGGTNGIGDLHAMFVLNAPPERFNLPARPRLPRRNIRPAALATSGAALGFVLLAACAFKRGA